MLIAVKSLIAHRDKQAIAAMLFPFTKDPLRPLQRICEGKMLLNSEQVHKLAVFLGLNVGSLYTLNSWTCTVTAPLTLIKGEVTAYYYPDTSRLLVQTPKYTYEEFIVKSRFTLSDMVDLIEKYLNSK